MQVEILLFDGFDEIDAVAPYEVFANAARHVEGLQVRLVTMPGAEGGSGLVEVVGAHGLRVRPHGVLGSPDLLVVPGGGWNDRSPQGAWAEAQSGAIPAAIAKLHAGGATVASVCTGGMLLSAAGITGGRPAITHHSAVEDLRASGARITQARVVDDGDLVTAGGVTSGLDLALWLVERYFGPQVALAIESEMEYERRGTVWRNVQAK